MRLLPVLFLLACSPEGPADSSSGAVESARDTRYCEVIPVFLEDGGLRADVWNTVGHNDCPQAEWDALDPERIGLDLGAMVVVMNGPRAFLMDEAEVEDRSSMESTAFGTLEMTLVATFEVALGQAQQEPYTERAIDRETVFSFWAGSEIYELLAPDGSAYVMQAYAMIVDPALTVDDLPGLGERLDVPEGWTWRARVLEERLDVATDGQGAVVVQDELQNTYQRYLDGA